MDDKYKKLGKNTGWMVIGNFASKLLSFFLVPLYTYYLTTSDYGIADLMTTTVSLLSPVLTVAASEGILRFTLDEKADKRKIFTITIIIFFVGFGILLLFSPIIMRISSFENYYGLFLLYYLSNVFTLLIQQFAKGLNRIKDYAIGGFIHTLVGASLNILLLAVYHIGVIGYLYAMIIGSIAPAIYLIIRLKIWRYICNPATISHEESSKYVLYCLPLVANQLSWWINNSSDKYILTYFWGTSVNGIYSVAYKIPSLIATISTIFYSAWQISAVDEFGTQASIDFYSSVYRKYVSLLVISSSGLILFIKVLAKILFAKDFYQSWPFAVILIIAAIFQSLNSFVGTIYTSAFKPKAIFYTTMLGALVNTILNFILIPTFSAYGAAIATLTSYIIIFVVRIFDSRKYLPLNIPIKRNITSYFLLMSEAVAICIGCVGWQMICTIITIIICYLNREIISDMVNIVFSKKRG